MKIDFSQLTVKDLSGKELPVHKELGNLIFNCANDVSLVEAGSQIYHGKEVDISPSEIKAIKALVDHKQQSGDFTFLAFVRKGLHEFIDKHTTQE